MKMVFPLTSSFQNWMLKVGPDDATLLIGTRDSVPMDHCSTLSQGVASASNNVGSTAIFRTFKCYPTLLETLATPRDCVEQCSTGTLSYQWAKLHRLGRPLEWVGPFSVMVYVCDRGKITANDTLHSYNLSMDQLTLFAASTLFKEGTW